MTHVKTQVDSMTIKSVDSVLINETDFEVIEQHYGVEIGEQLKNLIRNHNGSLTTRSNSDIVIKRIFPDAWSTEDILHTLFDTKDIIKQLEYIGYLEEMKESFELPNDFVDCSLLLPIFETNGGVIYVSLKSKDKSSLFYCDNGDFGIVHLSMSVDDFEFIK